MNNIAKLSLIAFVIVLVSACTDKKETPKDSPKIIITESNDNKEEAVQIPMHGTNEK